MTSPISRAPSQNTNNKYEGVHKKGSSFGQGLNEARVREILGQEISSPFRKIAEKVADLVADVVTGVADAITSDKAGYEEIRVAMDTRLGPIDTAITASGKEVTKLSNDVKENIEEQKKIRAAQQELLKKSDENLAAARTAVDNLEALNQEQQRKVSFYLSEAEENGKKMESILLKQETLIQASEDASKASESAISRVTTVEKRVTAEEQRRAREVKELTQKATDAQSRAEHAISRMDKVTNEQGALQPAFKKNMDTLVKNNDDLKKALAEAESATKALTGLVDIGGSLIALEPGTTNPVWRSKLKTEIGPAGTPVQGITLATNGSKVRKTEYFNKKLVKVSSRDRYVVSFWVRATGKSSLLFSMEDQDGTQHPLMTDKENRIEPTKNHDSALNLYWRNGWLIGLAGIDNQWRYAEYTIKMKPGVEFVTPKAIYWSYNGGGGGIEQQWLGGLSIEPELTNARIIEDLQDQVTSAVNKVSEATRKAESALGGIDAANRNLDSKIKAGIKASEDVQAAVDGAKDANKNLQNLVDVGASLIPLVPGTRTPAWTKMTEVTATTEKYANLPVFRGPRATVAPYPERRYAKVAPGTIYKVSFYAKASVANTKMFVELRDANTGGHAMAMTTQTPTGEDKTWRTSGYPVDNLTLTTGWQKYEWRIEFKPDVREVFLSRFYFNHSNGSGTGYQYIAGFDIAPFIDQATIDRLQNEAILKNSKVSGTNATAIQVMQKSWAAQDVVNKKQQEWNTAATQAKAAQDVLNKKQNDWNQAVTRTSSLMQNAILKNTLVGKDNAKAITTLTEARDIQLKWNASQEKWNKASRDATAAVTDASRANTRAIRALAGVDVGQSLIGYKPLTDAEIEKGMLTREYPVWTEAAPSSGTATVDGLSRRYWGISNSKAITKGASRVLMPVVEDQTYKLSFWGYGTGNLVIYLLDQSGNHAVAKTTQITGVNQETGERTYGKNGNSTNGWLLNRFTFQGGWRKYEFEVVFKPGVKQVSFGSFFWNHGDTTTDRYQRIADLEFAPDIPTQRDVNDALNRAVKNLKKQQDLDDKFKREQKNWNDVSAKATTANTQAIKALARLDIGASLVAYEDLTDDEILKQKLTVPWRPVWSTAARWHRNVNTASTGDKNFMKGQPYKDMFGSPVSAGTVSAKEAWVSVDPDAIYKVTFWAKSTVTNAAIQIFMKAPKGEPSSPIRKAYKVKPGGGKITWNKSKTGDTEITSHAPISKTWERFEFYFQVAPGVSALAFDRIDWSHGGATTGNVWVAGLDITPYIPDQAEVDRLQNESIDNLIKWQEEDKKSAKRQETINTSVENQIMIHQDMIELLDIRTPKTYGMQIINPDKFPSQNSGYSVFHKKTMRGYRWITPFFEAFLTADSTYGYVYIGFYGQWDGMFDIEVNWDSGVLDNWTKSVAGNNGNRSYKFKGGARHINMRSVQVTIYPRSLKREVTIKGTSVTDPNKLVREKTREYVRFKNTVTCNQYLYGRDIAGNLKSFSAGTPIAARYIYFKDLNSGATYKFTEADERDMEYSVPTQFTTNVASPQLVSAS